MDEKLGAGGKRGPKSSLAAAARAAGRPDASGEPAQLASPTRRAQKQDTRPRGGQLGRPATALDRRRRDAMRETARGSPRSMPRTLFRIAL